MSKTIESEQGTVVTQREALQILGINPEALSLLELTAKVATRRHRKGYSLDELRHLQSALKTMALQFA
jgi:hypothetical protein